MAQDYRGGNSRLLARTLDQGLGPAAVLDGAGRILYANAALCEMAKLDATELVSRVCSWEMASDQSPAGALLTALAPPASSRSGRISCRQLTTPPVFGSPVTGELFVPLLGPGGGVEVTIVLMGDWEHIRAQFANIADQPLSRRDAEAALAKLRGQWNNLDGLHALVGESPVVGLALARAQIAVDCECNVVLEGPADCGLAEIAQGIFGLRLRRLGAPRISGVHFPVDCAAIGVETLHSLLEVFQSRFKPELNRCNHNLVIQNLQALDGDAIDVLLSWYALHGDYCTITAMVTAGTTLQLAARSSTWQHAVGRFAEAEIRLPPLHTRRVDIALLVHHAVAVWAAANKRPPLQINPDAMDLLEAYPWPRNLLELRQAVESAAVLATAQGCILPQHLPLAIRTFPGSVQTERTSAAQPIRLDDVLLDLEREVIRRALMQSPRNRAQAARNLGISRPRLLRRIEQLGLDELSDQVGKGSADDDLAAGS